MAKAVVRTCCVDRTHQANGSQDNTDLCDAPEELDPAEDL
jgi:hypothetical protein